ncbi:hypothetical protein HN51_063834 [Arachis hypogaea]|nr:uncharacterized protein DS421_11g346660 [Arachis hypogaea]
MEPDPSFTFSSTDVQSLADLLADLVLGEKSVDDDLRPKQEFMCPFCGEIHDADALSYHIHDQHPRHLTNGDCPICEDSFGMELVGHIAKEHGDLLKISFRSWDSFHFLVIFSFHLLLNWIHSYLIAPATLIRGYILIWYISFQLLFFFLLDVMDNWCGFYKFLLDQKLRAAQKKVQNWRPESYIETRTG